MSNYLCFDGLDQLLKAVNTRFGNYLTAAQSDQKYATQASLEAILELGATPTSITSTTLSVGGTPFSRTIELAANQLRTATWNSSTSYGFSKMWINSVVVFVLCSPALLLNLLYSVSATSYFPYFDIVLFMVAGDSKPSLL